MHAWFEREVYPTAKVWHDQYDASLSREDLSELTRLRAEAKRIRESVITDIKNIASNADRESRSEMKEQVRNLREKYRGELQDLIDRVKPIAKRSRTMLRQLFDENEDKNEAWRDKARQIVGDWRDEHDDIGFRGEFGKGGMKLPLIAGDGRKAALRFILWDGTMPDQHTSRTATKIRMPMTVAPAPTGNSATVSALNVPDGQHTLQLFDMNGTMLRSIQVSSAAGKVQQSVDLAGLPAGTYVVSINTPAGRSTTNLVINK
jgi:F0F1-type ATP synthase membrane subunit b/b'